MMVLTPVMPTPVMAGEARPWMAIGAGMPTVVRVMAGEARLWMAIGAGMPVIVAGEARPVMAVGVMCGGHGPFLLHESRPL